MSKKGKEILILSSSFVCSISKQAYRKREEQKFKEYWEGEERVEEQGGRGIAKITMVVTMMKTMIMAVMMMIATKRMMILTMKTKMLRMVK